MRILDGTFALISLLGFILSVIFTASGRVGELGSFGFKLGFTLTFFFTISVIASMVSIYPKDEL
jgi:uncharacterized membrane protein